MDGTIGGISIRRRAIVAAGGPPATGFQAVVTETVLIVAGAAEAPPATRRAPGAGRAAGIRHPRAALRLALLGAATGVLAGGALAQLGLPAALRRLPAPGRALRRLPAPAASRRLPF
ncbi:MAG TPA: hypothetical protein VFL91_09565 [Thermomicrobiales bacterium]|nr:hypothetical protein [Thermomicrobiales bacterium]